MIGVAPVSYTIKSEAARKLSLSPSSFWPCPTSSPPNSLPPKNDAAVELEHCEYRVVALAAVACVDTGKRLSFSLARVRHPRLAGLHIAVSYIPPIVVNSVAPQEVKEKRQCGWELGVEFGSVIDNPAAKNRCMPSLMPSSTAGPVRPATTVEAGLVTVFEGVLDTASGGDCDLSRPRFTMRSHLRLLCTYQGERLTLGKEES